MENVPATAGRAAANGSPAPAGLTETRSNACQSASVQWAFDSAATVAAGRPVTSTVLVWELS